jgi:hypothetical protein
MSACVISILPTTRASFWVLVATLHWQHCREARMPTHAQNHYYHRIGILLSGRRRGRWTQRRGAPPYPGQEMCENCAGWLPWPSPDQGVPVLLGWNRAPVARTLSEVTQPHDIAQSWQVSDVYSLGHEY